MVTRERLPVTRNPRRKTDGWIRMELVGKLFEKETEPTASYTNYIDLEAEQKFRATRNCV